MGKKNKKTSKFKLRILGIRINKKILFFSLIVILLLIFFIYKLLPKGSIGGYITKDGKPISGRMIRLARGEVRHRIASTHTDANGYYRFSFLNPDLYFVEKEDAQGDSSYSVGYDKKGNPTIGETEITFNFKKQTTGIYLVKNQIINNLDYDVTWPSNYQDFPDKYTYTIDQYTGVPLQTPQPTAPPTPTMTMPRSLENNFVAIPELGIKMQIADEIKDLIYGVNYTSKDAISIQFSTRSIVALDKGCGPLDDPVGGIIRTSSYHSIEENSGEAKKIGNYYYAITTPQAYCVSDPNNLKAGKLISNLRESLQNAYQTLQPL